MDIIYTIKNENIKYKLSVKKISNKHTNNIINSYSEFSKLYNKVSIESLKNKDILYYINSTKLFSLYEYNKNSIIQYLLNLLDIQNFNLYYIKNNKLLVKNNNKNKNNNNKNIENHKLHILPNTIESLNKNNILNDIYNCNFVVILYNLCIKFIKNIFKVLKNGDSIAFYGINYCNESMINLYYILSLIFEKVLILDAKIIICLNFNDKSEYIKYINDFDESKNEYLDIEPKPNLDKLKIYLNSVFESYIKLYNLILKKDEDKIFIETFNFYTSFAKDTFIKEHDKDNLYHKYLQKYFIENFRRLMFTQNNKTIKEVKIHSAIKKEEGNNIQYIIKKYKLKKCLEVGMAFGISAFYILSSNKNVSLISIDPFQKDPKQWNSMGLNLIKHLNLDEKHHFIEDLSYISLPKLLDSYGKNYFDFIFIDGWHTFDYTLIDFFYADKLLRKDGVILIDDALHEGVKKFVKYIETNYKNYKKIDTSITQAGFIKTEEDSREWFFHSGF
jgi:predicted O-methyltransferase YrrM